MLIYDFVYFIFLTQCCIAETQQAQNPGNFLALAYVGSHCIGIKRIFRVSLYVYTGMIKPQMSPRVDEIEHSVPRVCCVQFQIDSNSLVM